MAWHVLAKACLGRPPQKMQPCRFASRAAEANAVRCTNNVQLWGFLQQRFVFPCLVFANRRYRNSTSPPQDKEVGLNHFAAAHAASPCLSTAVCAATCRHPGPAGSMQFDMKQLSFMQSTLMIFHVMIMRPLVSFAFSVRLVLHLNVLLLLGIIHPGYLSIDWSQRRNGNSVRPYMLAYAGDWTQT